MVAVMVGVMVVVRVVVMVVVTVAVTVVDMMITVILVQLVIADGKNILEVIQPQLEIDIEPERELLVNVKIYMAVVM